MKEAAPTARRGERLRRLAGLYAIVDGSSPHRPLELVDAFLRAEVPVLQLRLKDLGAGELLVVAREAVARCRGRALLLVNDRPDVAALAGADGVHLGQEDLPVEAARTVLGPDALIGVSTHDLAELDAAVRSGADYAGFGPIFATASKAAALPPPHGLDGLARAVAAAPDLPIVAIGGLGEAQAAGVRAAGAACLAAIAALCQARDPEEQARRLVRAFDSRGSAT